jgi:intein/homing endonuclease
MFHVNEDTAEIIGIMLGDGNITVSNGSHTTTITLHVKEAKYAQIISRMIRRTFFQNPTISKMKNKNALRMRVYRKTFVNELCLLGLEEGDKMRGRIGIPEWVFGRKDFLRSCVRGLIDTDGSVYRLTPHWPNLIQITFKNNNKKLLRDVRSALIELGLKPSKIFGNRLVITRKSEVEKYFREVGTNNLRLAP